MVTMFATIKNRWFLLSLALAVLVITVRAISVPIEERPNLWGDGFSESNVYSAALYFKDHGFWKTRLLPMHGYQNRDPSTARVYTHYPALPDILGGVSLSILGSDDPRAARILPLLLSLVWLYVMIRLLKDLLPNRTAIVVSLAFILLSNYFISFADNIHQHQYGELGKWGFVWLMWSYHTSPRWRDTKLTVMAIIALILANISFEPITFVAVVTVGFTWVFRKRLFTMENIVLGLATTAGVCLHFWQNIVYLGGWEPAYADMHAAFLERTGASGVQVSWWHHLLMPYIMLNRVERMFLIPGWAFLFLGFLGLKRLRHEAPQTFQLALVLLAAGYSWSIAMMQHASVHPFTVRQFGIFLGLTAGYGVLAFRDSLTQAFTATNRWVQFFHVGLIIYIVGMTAKTHIWDLFIKRGLFHWLF